MQTQSASDQYVSPQSFQYLTAGMKTNLEQSFYEYVSDEDE